MPPSLSSPIVRVTAALLAFVLAAAPGLLAAPKGDPSPPVFPGEWVRVEMALDGDTVVLEGGGKLRLLGIDAPEVQRNESGRAAPGEEGAAEARELLERLVVGRRVGIEQDWQKEDSYRRKLAYLFLEDGTCANEELLRAGWAFAYTRFPFARIDQFRRAESEARRDGRGLWGRAARSPVLPPEGASERRGEVRRVQGKIRRVRMAGSIALLEFDESGAVPLTAVIYPEDRRLFPSAPSGYEGEWLRVTGKLEGEHGYTEIVLRSPEQVEVLPPQVLKVGEVLKPEEVGRYVGRRVQVEGTVLSSFDSGKAVYLYFGSDRERDLRAVIFADTLPFFPVSPAEYYRDRRLRVAGIVRDGRGRPEIVIEDPGQIEVLE